MIQLEVVDACPSTSDALRCRAEAGGGEAALVAGLQTAGRGRLGRTWTSPPGNVHLSVLLRPGAAVVPGHWSLLAAVALAACVAPLVAPGAVRLKWPNDVLLDGGKVGGILLDAGGSPAWIVIGFGVNLVAAPEGLGRRVACLADHGAAPAPEAFACALVQRLDDGRRAYERDGFAPVRAAWSALGPEAGSAVAVNGAAGRIEGRFLGIEPDGAMLVEQDGRRRRIVSGEVE